MCGIAGYARATIDAKPIEAADILRRMTAALTHRGPDASGYHDSERVKLGHRRLSIIDLSGGAQPMHDDGRGLHVVYNGEIYNYLELNVELAGKGFAARTRSDTETILLAYAAWGEACVEKFNGMFAFAIHDEKQNRIFCARDRMGKKPFYYVHDGGFFAFASEPKALLQHPAVRREMDPEAAARYLLHEFVPAPYAIYRGMRKLPGGHRLRFDLGGGSLATERWWDHDFAAAEKDTATEAEWIERIRGGLQAAVERRLIADVPLGVFLSGGIDSSAVTAAMVAKQGRGKVKTFAIGFSDPRFDETAYAKRLAETLGTEHYEERLDPKASLDILPTVAAFLDEPFADPSILPTYLLSRFTRRHVTVALGGDGGDELFAGYDTFRALPHLRFYNAAVPGFVDRGVVRPLAGCLPASTGNFSFDFVVQRFLRGAKRPESERLWRWLGAFVPEEIGGLLTGDALKTVALEKLFDETSELHARVARFDPATRDGYVYAKTYLGEGVLTKVDRATMACSLEARSPLLDRDFVALADAMPARYKVRGGKLKYLFKKALRGLVPDDILARPKKGFGIPVAGWFRGGLREALLDTLHEKRLREDGFFRPEAVKRLVDEHVTGRRNHRKPLWTLFMFERWRAHWLKPAKAPSGEVPLVVEAREEPAPPAQKV
ncbi:MAG: asparagine synthase (glutamine-hydrolyzing) [Planctomycetes bacterium]|nr:asparagine synthase (glutamine-hydrolyzing) [Planctomycetota bacterium]